jgi:hypothetical protein
MEFFFLFTVSIMSVRATCICIDLKIKLLTGV